jgi:hypothetical protein
MDVDDVAPSGSGTLMRSLFKRSFLCIQSFFFYAGHASIIHPSPFSIDDSGSYGKFTPVPYKPSFFLIFYFF